MDVSLVVHIARTFEERVSDFLSFDPSDRYGNNYLAKLRVLHMPQVEELKAKSHSAYDYSNEIDHLQNRAVQYWREACDILEKFQRYGFQMSKFPETCCKHSCDGYKNSC